MAEHDQDENAVERPDGPAGTPEQRADALAERTQREADQIAEEMGGSVGRAEAMGDRVEPIPAPTADDENSSEGQLGR